MAKPLARVLALLDILQTGGTRTLRGGIAEKITCPVFVGRGESDVFFLGQPEALMEHLTAPATLGNFTDAEGAGAHVQAGAFRLLCARMLDWLDETLGTPAQLADASVEQR